MSSVHVLGFAGSLRRDSYNKKLLHVAQELLPAGMTLEIFDLLPIPLYNADVEAQGMPAPVQHFRERMAAADALLIATPEYNYSISGVLKNALDWASRGGPASPLNHKPLAMMGAGGRFGTIRAQQHLRQIALHNDMHVLNRPEVYIARPWELFDVDGRLTHEPTRERIQMLLEALAAWTRKLRCSRANEE